MMIPAQLRLVMFLLCGLLIKKDCRNVSKDRANTTIRIQTMISRIALFLSLVLFSKKFCLCSQLIKMLS